MLPITIGAYSLTAAKISDTSKLRARKALMSSKGPGIFPYEKIPLSFESSGAFGENMKILWAELKARHNKIQKEDYIRAGLSYTFTAFTFSEYWSQRISFATAKFIARMVMDGLFRAKRRIVDQAFTPRHDQFFWQDCSFTPRWRNLGKKREAAALWHEGLLSVLCTAHAPFDAMNRAQRHLFTWLCCHATLWSIFAQSALNSSLNSSLCPNTVSALSPSHAVLAHALPLHPLLSPAMLAHALSPHSFLQPLLAAAALHWLTAAYCASLLSHAIQLLLCSTCCWVLLCSTAWSRGSTPLPSPSHNPPACCWPLLALLGRQVLSSPSSCQYS